MKTEKTVSQNDITFLHKVEQGIQKNIHGHYEMPLPFKPRPSLPNNRDSALTCLNHLKRKLQRDGKYKEQYVKFMEEVIERGDAEPVKDGGSKGERWYIPHHGARHTKINFA